MESVAERRGLNLDVRFPWFFCSAFGRCCAGKFVFIWKYSSFQNTATTGQAFRNVFCKIKTTCLISISHSLVVLQFIWKYLELLSYAISYCCVMNVESNLYLLKIYSQIIVCFTSNIRSHPVTDLPKVISASEQICPTSMIVIVLSIDTRSTRRALANSDTKNHVHLSTSKIFCFP